MTRGLPLAGLATAFALAAIAGQLVARPTSASPPAMVDQVAPAALVPPDDAPLLVRDPPPQDTPNALAKGMRVLVPRLRIDLPLEIGDSARDVVEQSTPAAAAYLLPATAVPGTTGNAYVYAHARPGLFLALWSVRLGDVVEIAEPSGLALRYAVTEIHPRVDPTDARFIAPTDDERLTLQTSTGPWVLSPRFVVVARPIP